MNPFGVRWINIFNREGPVGSFGFGRQGPGKGFVETSLEGEPVNVWDW